VKQNGTNTEAPDEIVRMAIAYLDSGTNYREFIGRTEQPTVTTCGRDQRQQSQEESLWLLLVPVVVIIITVVAFIVR
jgi:ABC-type dipeptide/oligopeptide/nickel transport system permease subunit